MSIASRITAIEEHIRDIYDTIDYSYDTTGVDKNIINIPQNIFNGYINVLNDNGQSLWNALEKVSQADVTEAELSNVETAPIKMVLNGNTSQDGTPTPDYPQEVKVVKGENVVSISGENQSDKTDYPINLGDIELCKINTYKDFPFKAINGNEYYDTLTDEQKNALVYGKWYMHKEINKIVLDGSEQMYFQGSESTPTKRTVLRWTLPTFALTADYLSNKFIKGSSTSNRIVMVAESNRPYISIDNLLTEINVEDDKSTKLAKFKSWLSNNNVTLYYVLSVPTETEITNTTLIEQLEAIYKAKSVKDKTYITQTNDELPFILAVEAIKEYSVE